MPVEIRELVIRAVATPEQKDVRPTEAQGTRPGPRSGDNLDAIVQECVRQVLRILQKERDR